MHIDELLARVCSDFPITALPHSFSTRIGDQAYDFSIWNGEQLESPLAVDTETYVEEFPPRLVLATASDGKQHVAIRGQDVASFLGVHGGKQLIFHNAAFDVPVLIRHLGNDASLLWNTLDRDRLRDTMVLAYCIHMFETGSESKGFDLGTLATKYTTLSVDKDSPYREKFHEIAGRDLAQVDPGFLQYAVADAIATWFLDEALQRHAQQLLTPFGKHFVAEFIQRDGYFSESIQAKANIVLALMSHRGVCVDVERGSQLRSEEEPKLHELVAKLEALQQNLFKRYKKTGKFKTTQFGIPCKSDLEVRARLEEIARVNKLALPRTAKGHISISQKDWDAHRGVDRFVDLYQDFKQQAKVFEFLDKYKVPRVYPRYRFTVRTGRTSCSGPNIQQLKRGKYREMIVASPGTVFVICDYSFIELVTLAAHCDFRFGYSLMGDAIKAGRDPHCYTASQIMGMEYEGFLKLKDTGPDDYRYQRQQAKALNFGLPGGLGPRSLAHVAATSYGVEMSEQQARDFRKKVIRHIYPEIGEHLDADAYAGLAFNLGVDESAVRDMFDPKFLGCLERVVRGKPTKSNGTPYDAGFVEDLWQAVASLNNNYRLNDRILNREAGDGLARDLFNYPAFNFAGFARGRCSYTERKNFPFQSLAALGVKLAMWRLMRAGYQPTIMVHDEIVCEIPEDCDQEHARRQIEQIMVEAMQEFTRGIPVKVESSVSGRWEKV